MVVVTSREYGFDDLFGRLGLQVQGDAADFVSYSAYARRQQEQEADSDEWECTWRRTSV